MDDLISTLQGLVSDPENIKYLIPLAITAALVLIWKAGRYVAIPLLLAIIGLVFRFRISPGLCKDILEVLADSHRVLVNGTDVQKGNLKVSTEPGKSYSKNGAIRVDDKAVDHLLSRREQRKIIKRAKKVHAQVEASEKSLLRDLYAEKVRSGKVG